MKVGGRPGLSAHAQCGQPVSAMHVGLEAVKNVVGLCSKR